MDNDNNKNSIQQNVLKAISAGKVKMRPKWIFVFHTALLVVGTILIALTVLYLASLIIFILRQTGVLHVPGFGLHGINTFFASAPWILILIAIVFIILLQVLIKKYSFGYGRPLLYSAFGIILLVVVGGLLVEKTSVHRQLFMRAENHNLPMAGGLYRLFGERDHDGITIGAIIEFRDPDFTISTQGGEVVMVDVTPQTKSFPGMILNVGKIVEVFGGRHDNLVTAEGIREFDGQMRPGRGGPPPFHIPAQ